MFEQQDRSSTSTIISQLSNQKKTIIRHSSQQKPNKIILTKRWLSSFIHSEKMVVFVATMYVSIVIFIGVLFVYINTPQRNKICRLTFRRTMKSKIVSSPHPRSVALGDLNNDDHLDIIIANSGNNTIGIFFGKGDGIFQDQQIYFTSSRSRPYSVVVNHFNNDSYLDIAVANYGINQIMIFFGNREGIFIDQQTFSLGSFRPYFITTSDINQDNRMDIIVANPDTDNINVLLGNGDGSFQDQITLLTGYDSFPCSLAVGDLNNDDQPDIVVANYGTDNIGIFLGYGNGIFTSQQIYSLPFKSDPSSIIVADFNHDNHFDIAVANNGTGNIIIFLGYGNGSFRAQAPYVIGVDSHPQFITVGRLNEDEILDLIVVDAANDRIHILPGHGNGSFATITTYDAISDSSPVCVGVKDLNKDNRSDIAVVAEHGTHSVSVLMDYFMKPSARQVIYRGEPKRSASRIAVEDFNNDQILDIVYTSQNFIPILIGVGDGSFTTGHEYWTLRPIRPFCIRAADLDNDMHMDIAIANYDGNSIDVLLDFGFGKMGSRRTSYSVGNDSRPSWIAIGDFNHDHILDIVSANQGSNTIGVLLGNGNGTFLTAVIYPIGIGSKPHFVAVSHVNNDTYLDAIVVNDDYYLVIFLGFENGIFIKSKTYSLNTGYVLYSIALADFNNDNHQDMAVTSVFTNTIHILLGHGDGTFTAATNYSTGVGGQPYFIIVADFNYDSISDLAVSNIGTNEIVIFHGYGNGSFELVKKYPTGFGSSPSDIIAVDLNNDQQLEIVVSLMGTGDVAILTEYVAAEFVSQTKYLTGSASRPSSVAVSTFNNHSRSEIVVANSGSDNLNILFAADNNISDTKIVYPIGVDSSPQYVITCDINQDNYPDIISVNSKSNDISVILTYGNDSFAEQLIYSTGENSRPRSITCSDLNNDSRLDLIIANKGSDNIGVLMSFDYISFRNEMNYSRIDYVHPGDVVVKDFNNDGYADIAVVFYSSHALGILLGDNNGNFSTMMTYSTGNSSGPWKIAIADFNNDYRWDIVVANYDSSSIGILLGYGNGSFVPVAIYPTGNMSRANDVDVGDFDGDGYLDIVVVNYDTDNIGVLLGHGDGTFGIIQTYTTGAKSQPISVIVADVNHDDRLDIIVGNSETYNIGVLLGRGDGTFETQVIFSTASYGGPYWITIGDFNSDNHTDIAIAFSVDVVGIMLGMGNGNFSSIAQYETGSGSSPSCVHVADFNNDNISDIVVTNSKTSNIVVMFGLGDGTFLLGRSYSVGSGSTPYAVAAGDFNNDGQLDLAVANYHSNRIGILFARGTEPFGSITMYDTGYKSRPYSIATGDFNGDNRLDIVVANYNADNVGVFFANDNRYFDNIRTVIKDTGSLPYSIVAADINNDQLLDIIVSYSGTDQIAILLGYGNGSFARRILHSTGYRSRPYTIALADLDHDGKSDVVVANSGTSNILLLYGYENETFQSEATYYLGYEYYPYSLAVTDLNDDGWLDIIIACYNTDRIEILMKMC